MESSHLDCLDHLAQPSGAGWKQMPSDLSSPRLGERPFHLLDDMNNWGLPKRLIAEVDVFKELPAAEVSACFR